MGEWKVIGSTQGVKCIVNGVPTLTCFEAIFQNILIVSSGLIMIALFAMFVYGGFMYLTSFGSPEKMKKAQGTFRYAIIGFALYLSAFLILKIIDVLFLGGYGKIFQFQIGG